MSPDRNECAQLEGVLETALYVDDLDAAEIFYGAVLGFEQVIKSEGLFVFFRCGTTVVLLFNADETIKQPFAPPARQVPGHGAHGPGHICFSASGDNFDRWRTRLVAHDVEIEAEIIWDNGARSVYFRDPAGNSLEFAEPRLWGYGPKDQTQ